MATTSATSDSGNGSADSTDGGTVEPTTAGPSDGSDVDSDVGGSGDDLDDVPDDSGAAATPDVGPPADIRPGSYTLEARLAPDGPPLGDGVKWRIFADTLGNDGHMQMLGQADGGIVYFGLSPGTYYVHAAYGRAGATRKLTVADRTGGQVVVLNAGGMRLTAVNGKDTPLGTGDVTFDIYAPDEAGAEERFLLVPNAPPGHIISLNAGVYHVVCKYGSGNAVVSADIKIEAGKLSEATLFEKAAKLTLKLVEQHGGEALADTAWSVTTPKGDQVAQTVGAFPTVVLSAGDYIAIAKHDGKEYQANFNVATGADHDVEVLAQAQP
ncbi:MAG TPA: hypothetical protein VG894_05660 [Bauldia sp.]|nr:hypothetical protein [Bauldia sp.]